MTDNDQITNNTMSLATDETAVLKRSRGMIKRQLTSSETALSSINENTDFATFNPEYRLEKHLKLWDAFDTIQSQLEKSIVD